MTMEESKIILDAGNAVIAGYDSAAKTLAVANQFRAASEQMSLALGATACLSAIIRALADSYIEKPT